MDIMYLHRTVGDAEKHLPAVVGHGVESLRVMLIVWTRVQPQTLDQLLTLVFGQLQQQTVVVDHLERLRGFLGETATGVGMAVGIGDVGLDVVDRGTSTRSAPATTSTGPGSMRSRRTLERPTGLGRKGLRVAKTPTLLLPPSRGGRTVELHFSRSAK